MHRPGESVAAWARTGALGVLLFAHAARADLRVEPGGPAERRPWAYTAPAPLKRGAGPAGDDLAAGEERRQRLAAAQAHLDAANAAAREGDWNTAAAEMERTLALVPDRGDVVARAAHIFMRHGSYGLAATCWSQLIANFPDVAGLHSELGAALLYMGRLDDADARFGDALRRNPEDLQARFYRAALRLKQQRPQEAAPALGALSTAEIWELCGGLPDESEALRRLLGADDYAALVRLVLAQPDAPVVPEDLRRIHEHCGQALDAMRHERWTAAAGHLRDAERAGLRATSLLYDLAFCHYRAAPSPEALAKLERVVKQRPDGARFARAFVYLCLAQEDYAAAERGLALMPERTDEAVLLRAAWLAGQGRVDDAWAALGAIPADRRPRLAPWFQQDLPSARLLRESAGYARWLPAPPAP